MNVLLVAKRHAIGCLYYKLLQRARGPEGAAQDKGADHSKPSGASTSTEKKSAELKGEQNCAQASIPPGHTTPSSVYHSAASVCLPIAPGL